MLKKTILASSLFLTTISYAQLRVGIESNSQYYIDDDKIKLDPIERDERLRSNNYIKLDYSLKNFEFGLQGEGYYPKAILNYNPQLKDFNVGHVFVRYHNYEKGVDITAGHIYEQFGSGLALRFWEDRALGINNALFGGRAKLRIGEAATLKLLGGKQRVGMGFDFSDGVVYGADTEIDVTNLLGKENYTLKFGATYVGRYEDLKNYNESAPKTVNVIGPRIDYSGNKFNFSTEYLYKTEDMHAENTKVINETLREGNAFLMNMGYNSGAFAVNLNLRRLENFGFFTQKNLTGNVFNYGMVNYLPSLVKQYDHTLQNIYVYQALAKMSFEKDREKVGEIGGQFDMFFEAEKGSFLGGKSGASFAINGSYWAGLKADLINKVDEYDWEYTSDIKTSIFGVGKKAYSDIGIEYRKPMSEKVNTIFSYLNQFYNSDYLEGKGYAVNTHVVAGEATYFLSDMKSVRLELQHLWADNDRKNWVGGTLEYIPSSKWSFYVQDIYNYGTDVEVQKLHYYNFGGAYTKGATRIAANYGRQRGGMVCVGGVCRWVPESAGFTLNITTNF